MQTIAHALDHLPFGNANHVVEQTLAHAICSAVEAAYRRGDLLEKYRVLMDDWANFVLKSPAHVAPLRAAG